MDSLAAPVLLFDGVCNLCDGAVLFVLAHDRTGAIRFAPLQSASGRALLQQAGLPEDYLGSLVFVDGTGARVGADAALALTPFLRAPWAWLRVLGVLPRGVRDALYGLVARHRYRVFGQRAACRLPTPEERHRFLEIA